MKNQLAFITIITFSLSVNAQLYTPTGTIQGTTPNDNVGIGTNSPGAKLSVQAAENGYPTPLKAISIMGPNSPANSNSARDLSWDFAAAGSAVIRSYRGGGYDTYMQFMTNSQYAGGNFPTIRMHIGENGNVGIGTTSPTSALDVFGTIKSYEPAPLGVPLHSFQLINSKSGNVGENTMINNVWTYRDGLLNNWYNSRLHDGISIEGSFTSPNVNTRTWWERDPYDDIQSWGNAAETYFTISKGYVGIGTVSPDEKLTVRGKIHTQEVRVDMSGPLSVPDYVFAEDYKLKTLQEVERYIRQNSHLPEIPSAQEIEKDGLMLAEMNMSLLKKIEELTLYMIEQNKRLDNIESENKDLRNKIKLLEEKNKRI